MVSACRAFCVFSQLVYKLSVLVAVVLDTLASVTLALLTASWLPPALSLVRAVCIAFALLVAKRKGRVVSSGARHAALLARVPGKSGEKEEEEEEEEEEQGEAVGLVAAEAGAAAAAEEEGEGAADVYWWQSGLVVAVVVATVASVVPLVMRLALASPPALASSVATLSVLCAYAAMARARQAVVRLTADPGLKVRWLVIRFAFSPG